jgi:hypothetical protein
MEQLNGTFSGILGAGLAAPDCLLTHTHHPHHSVPLKHQNCAEPKVAKIMSGLGASSQGKRNFGRILALNY